MVGVCFRNGWAVLWLVVLLRVVRSSFFIPRANYPLIIIMHPPYFFIFNFFLSPLFLFTLAFVLFNMSSSVSVIADLLNC